MQKLIDLQRLLRAKTAGAQTRRAGSATEKYYGFNSKRMAMKQTCSDINSCAPMGKAVTRFIDHAQQKSLGIDEAVHLSRDGIRQLQGVEAKHQGE